MYEQLFRTEAGRMIAALTRIFGVHNLPLAEDVVQDAFCRAIRTWTGGPPANPAAWLMMTARNRALDILRREQTARRFAPEMGRLLESEWTRVAAVDEAFDDHVVRDEQLRMMFSCCEPRLGEPVQLALILNLLGGFAAGEIAAALLEGRAAIEKRLSRGKKALRAAKRLIELTDADFLVRLPVVRRALYLTFNEGYHATWTRTATRVDLCHDALRLTALLSAYPATAGPETDALLALMCLHAARLPARTDADGHLHPWRRQDRARWDWRLVAQGLAFFERSAAGNDLTAYHVEAAIAAAHASASTPEATDWTLIVDLYDRLQLLAPSPIVALNRAIAIGQRDGAECGLAALNLIPSRERLRTYPFYSAALGEMELLRGNHAAAREQFAVALSVARNAAERTFLEERLRELEGLHA